MSDRSDKWHATRHARELALFSGKRFEVVREVKGDEPFKTPLGYSAKNGYEVRDVVSGDTFKVGKTTLKVMAEKYNAVTLPPPKKRGRPKKVSPVITQNRSGGYIPGPGPNDPYDSIPAVLSVGHVVPAYLADKYGPEVIERMNIMAKDDEKQENGNDPGAHPVADREPDSNDRSGSNAGPTFDNPNEDIHISADE